MISTCSSPISSFSELVLFASVTPISVEGFIISPSATTALIRNISISPLSMFSTISKFASCPYFFFMIMERVSSMILCMMSRSMLLSRTSSANESTTSVLRAITISPTNQYPILLLLKFYLNNGVAHCARRILDGVPFAVLKLQGILAHFPQPHLHRFLFAILCKREADRPADVLPELPPVFKRPLDARRPHPQIVPLEIGIRILDAVFNIPAQYGIIVNGQCAFGIG